MKIKLSELSVTQKFLVILPLLLILTTYFAFKIFVDFFGLKIGYLAGFVFYWIFWGLVVPFFILKIEGIRSIFAHTKRTGHDWVNIVLLIVPCLLAIFFGPFFQRLNGITWGIGAVSLVVAVVNALAEEIIWRGLYFKNFESPLLGCVFPILFFGIWHISPNSVNPTSLGVPLFVFFSALLGTFWGISAYRMKSIRWTVISHIIVDFSGLIGVFYLT